MRASLGAKLALAATSLLLTLIALEVAARVYLVHVADEWTFLRYASTEQLERRYGRDGENDLARITYPPFLAAYSAHRYLGYAPTPGYEHGANRHNSLGLRGAEIPVLKPLGEYRIACLGGSTTYTTSVEDWRLSYPALLEQELHNAGLGSVCVLNCGAAGWSSWESLINLETRVLDLDPDLIVVYHAINDVHARLVWPPESYRGDNSGCLIHPGSDHHPHGSFEQSTLLRALLVRSGRALPHSSFLRTLSVTAPTYYGDLFQTQWLDGSYPNGIFERVSAMEMLRRNPPIYFRRNLEDMVTVADAHGVATVLATFASSARFEHFPRVASEEYVTALEEMNEVVRAVAHDTGAHLFDFARVFPDDERYFVDGRHVTAEGCRLQAALFAEYLLESGLLPGPGPHS